MWSLSVLAAPVLLGLYAYVLYPALLRLIPAYRPAQLPAERTVLPLVSVSLPARNEARQIRGAIDALLASDYPAEYLHVLVISDASDDGTDDIVREYAGRGVELLRLDQRGGKTAAEQAAFGRLRGDIIVNTDASIRVQPGAIRALVAAFADPTVGVASGRDVSVSAANDDRNASEGKYVGYEMAVRALETRVGGIVGSSGCLYAIRSDLHRHFLPEHLSRDFASALVAHEHGYRAVSIDAARCLVPRTASLKREYRRKVRTITRGMQTLGYKRHLLNPLRHGRFAWMLLSHKIARWLLPPVLLVSTAMLFVLAVELPWARVLAGAVAAGTAVVTLAFFRPERAPRALTALAAAAAANLAVVQALLHAPFDGTPVWEPTKREAVPADSAATGAVQDGR